MTHESANKTGNRAVDGESVRYTVLSRRTIALWALLIVAAGVGMAAWLLRVYGVGDDPRVRLDAIRTAGTLVVGAGGGAALLLAARRQRSTEIALKQKDRDQADVARAHALQERVAAETQAHQNSVAAATEHDAAQRRVTDLYTAAAAQLGSDKAPVRLAGLYALGRLAQDTPHQRQTIVNVLCAYLRMPYTLPDNPPDGHIDLDQVAMHTERVQEREVRLTAQRILTAHLQPGKATNPADTFWADIDLDLTGAVLVNVDLSRCQLRTVEFTHAKFTGHASFDWAAFTGDVSFDTAKFTGSVSFDWATFAAHTSFRKVEFASHATFEDARFAWGASFDDAEFAADAWFYKAKSAGTVLFHTVKFTGTTTFDEAEFAGASFDSATFEEAKVADHASLDAAESADEPPYGGVSFKAVIFAHQVPTEVQRFWSPPQQGKRRTRRRILRRSRTAGPTEPTAERVKPA